MTGILVPNSPLEIKEIVNAGMAGSERHGKTRIAVWVFCLFALAEFAARGPFRAAHHADFNDFISPYIQTQAWLKGQDPYDPRVVAGLWPRQADAPEFLLEEGRDGTLPAKRGIPSPYPIAAFPLLVPLALMPWPVAFAFWTIATTLAFVVIVYCVLLLGRIRVLSFEGLLVSAAAFAFAPFHTAISLTNIVVVVVAFGMLAIVSSEHHKIFSAGLLLAVATALKPTAALFFLIYFLVRGPWKSLVVAFAGTILLLAVADVRTWSVGVHWLPSYTLNAQRMFGAGAIDDYTPANVTRYDLLNLQLVFFQVVGRKLWAEILSWLVVLGLLGRWIISSRRQPDPTDPLLDLAILAAIGLLPFYHRFTDGGMLFPAVAWAIREFYRFRRVAAGVTLIFATPFLVPGAAILQVLRASNARVDALARDWWWQFLLAPHQVWMVLAISVTLLVAQGQLVQRSRSAPYHDKESCNV